jgi:methylisocitrate lyase
MTAKWLNGANVPTALTPGIPTLSASGGTIAVAGAWDGISAALAARAGFKALYLSGAALSASMALPDLGLLTLDDVWRAARTVIRASGLPLIVDCDTGFGEALNVMRLVKEMESIGVSCIQIEDQQFPKKCGHLNDKKLVSAEDMCRKISAARHASDKLAICARTDAAFVSLDEAIHRANLYAKAGASVIFVEALTNLDDIRRVRAEVDAPLLANMTEFGRTPQIPLKQWEALGYELVIYPVSALRVASRSMERFYQSLAAHGDVDEFLPDMMTRAELYERIGYFDFEKLDEQITKTILPM